MALLLVDVGRPCSTMLDDLDQLMSTGALPNIFKPEEVTSIAQQLKPVARSAGLTWTEYDRTGAAAARTHAHMALVLAPGNGTAPRRCMGDRSAGGKAVTLCVFQYSMDVRGRARRLLRRLFCVCARAGASDNVLRQYFVERCRQNLHVVLVMEQEGVALQRKVVTFPKMFHRCARARQRTHRLRACMHVGMHKGAGTSSLDDGRAAAP